jgi:DNA ligase-1
MSRHAYGPNLAANFHDKKKPMTPEMLRFPMYASPKIDGIRGIVHDGVVRSRSWKPIPNPWVQKALTQSTVLNWMDGELIVGSLEDPKAFEAARGPIMTYSGAPHFTFAVFDLFDPMQLLPYEARKEQLEKTVHKWHTTPHPGFNLICLEQKLLHSWDEVQEYEEEKVRMGYEGIMLRNLNAKYKFGRSTAREQGLIKLKRFEDAEGIIVGFEPLFRNKNEPVIDALGYQRRSSHQAGLVTEQLLGAFILRHPDFKNDFGVGSGMDLEERERFWKQRDELLGQQVRFKYQAHGSTSEAPRAPTFYGLRPPE